jgi:hypothetical protein
VISSSVSPKTDDVREHLSHAHQIGKSKTQRRRGAEHKQSKRGEAIGKGGENTIHRSGHHPKIREAKAKTLIDREGLDTMPPTTWSVTCES